MPRIFRVDEETSLLAQCHWQTREGLVGQTQAPVLVLIHGLEGSSESPYMLGTAEKAWTAGFNVVRLNQRTCGGSEHLTPTLYHSGRSDDLAAVVRALAADGFREVFVAGFSMGGNLALKMAGERGEELAASAGLKGVCGVSPALDLAACADALERPANRLYQWNFVWRLKARMARRCRQHPRRYDPSRLAAVRAVRQFDDAYTAPYSGFQDAADYYARSSAQRVLGSIRVPTLILTAQDDPFIPFASFRCLELVGSARNPHITFVAPAHGGHCAFIAPGFHRWAEQRLVSFCAGADRWEGRPQPL